MVKTNKALLYHQLTAQLKSLYENEKNFITNATNLCSLVFYSIPNINWVGFYFLHQEELVVGPYQGRVPCIRISLGKGICGTSAQKAQVIIENDVLTAANYITCDSETRSEIVLPLIAKDILIGIFDVDSTLKNNFDQDDSEGLQMLLNVFTHCTKMNLQIN